MCDYRLVPNRVPEYFEQVLINTFSHSVKFPFDQSVMSRRTSSTSFGPVLLKKYCTRVQELWPSGKNWPEGRKEGEKEGRDQGMEGRKDRR